MTTNPARVLHSARPGSTRALRMMASAVAAAVVVLGCACSRAPVDQAIASGESDVTSKPGEIENPGPVTATPAPAVGRPAEEKDAATTTAAVPPDLLGAAISDAVRRTGAARSDVKVVSAEAVTWPDGSMGCPQPGMMYTQALVPGYRIVLQAPGQTLNYHSSAKSGPTFCPAERVSAPTDRGADQT